MYHFRMIFPNFPGSWLAPRVRVIHRIYDTPTTAKTLLEKNLTRGSVAIIKCLWGRLTANSLQSNFGSGLGSTNSDSPQFPFRADIGKDEATMSAAEWDSQSDLLLVQLIYKYGDPQGTSPATATTTEVFDKIAHQLTNNSLIRPSKRKFTASVSLPLPSPLN